MSTVTRRRRCMWVDVLHNSHYDDCECVQVTAAERRCVRRRQQSVTHYRRQVACVRLSVVLRRLPQSPFTAPRLCIAFTSQRLQLVTTTRSSCTAAFCWLLPYWHGFLLPCYTAVSLYSAVFTCIGALGTPSRTGPLARKYLPGIPFSWTLRRLRQKISGIYCTVICNYPSAAQEQPFTVGLFIFVLQRQLSKVDQICTASVCTIMQ